MLRIDWEVEYEQSKKAALEEMGVLQEQEHLDEDGYPTNSALRLIEIWWHEDAEGWLKFINSLWHLSSWGWHEVDETHEFYEDRKVHRYYISTAGWSGNESIIRSMEKNEMLWHNIWVQSRRGGHYIFELEKEEINNAL